VHQAVEELIAADRLVEGARGRGSRFSIHSASSLR
jgi:hypothetical protein